MTNVKSLKKAAAAILAAVLCLSAVLFSGFQNVIPDMALQAEAAAADEYLTEFLNSGYDKMHYTVYDGTNENNTFNMSGRTYYQGFTLLGTDYQNTYVSFNVEDISTLSFDLGHLDSQGGAASSTINVYRDGEWWQDITINSTDFVTRKTFDVSSVSTLKFYISSQCRYGFGDVEIDGNTTSTPHVVPVYEDAVSFMNAGYDGMQYTVYSDADDNTSFNMNGRTYNQGFTLLGTDYQNTYVTFNVENVSKFSFDLGHLDSKGGAASSTIKVYRDGEWWQDIEINSDDIVTTKTLDVSKISTIKFYIASQCRYGFGDVKIDSMGTSVPHIVPEYADVLEFLESGYDRMQYTVYDGSNSNTSFNMNGRTYYQGFTLLGTDYQNTYVSFNVENVSKFSFDLGHLDDQGGAASSTIKVYRDGKWWQDIGINSDDIVTRKTLDVSKIKTLKFYISSQCRYGFGDVQIDAKASTVPHVVPKYADAVEFLEAGYDYMKYTVYDGSNENTNFNMNGRTYYQGFTLLGTDYQNTYVSFNVENVSKISFDLGHVDDQGGDASSTIKVYRDGVWWQDIEINSDDVVTRKNLDVSKAKTLKFYISSQCRYGFGDVQIDTKKTNMPHIVPDYEDSIEFLESGYDSMQYTVYDGSNEYNYFSMNGKKYDQGFTLRGTDYRNTYVFFNVENVDRITFTLGHIDDDGGDDQTIWIDIDGETFYGIDTKTTDVSKKYTLSLEGASTMKFYINSQSRYGFGNVELNDDYLNNKAYSDTSKIIDINKILEEEANKEEAKANLGDVNEDGTVDSSDASKVLAAYANKATGGDLGLTETQVLNADVNMDGAVDSSDASSILGFYAYSATGGEGTMAEYMGV